MRLIGLPLILTLSLILAPLAVQGQQAGQSKVGLLFLGTAGIDWTERSGIAVREGLRELGWVENQSTASPVAGATVSKDILGRVYEYFLGQFASAEGKMGGEFYTPRCVVQLLVGVPSDRSTPVVHLARGERARQPAVGEPGRQQGGRHPRRGGDGRVEPAGASGQPPGTMEDGEP